VLNPADVKTLVDLGGLALFVAFVVAAGMGLFRQAWVPGWLWRRERERRESAEAEVKKQAATISRLSRQLASERRRRSTDARR